MTHYFVVAISTVFVAIILSFLIPNGIAKKSITFVVKLVCIIALLMPMSKLIDGYQNEDQENEHASEYVIYCYELNQSNALLAVLQKQFDHVIDCKLEIEYINNQYQIKQLVVITENPSDPQKIYEYLQNMGYINITVYEKDSTVGEK